MYKYNGMLIYQSHDDDGVLEVVERDGVRSLHFGSYPRQSSMAVDFPDNLELAYVRAMTAWMLFKEPLSDEALIIGLGGGSLTKHLLYHFPDCRLKIIECRHSVIKIARSHFGLPLDARLKIIVDDGGRHLRQRVETYHQRFSVLLVDAFDHEGMAESINNKAFFEACQAVLKPDGILVINLWGGTSNPLFQQVALWLGQIFHWNILFLPVLGRGNIIGIAFNQAAFNFSLPALRDKANQLEQQFQIEFPTFLKDLKKHNSSTFDKLIRS